MWGRKQRQIDLLAKALSDIYWANDPNDPKNALKIDRIASDALTEAVKS